MFADSGAPAPAPPEWYTAHCDGGSRGNPGPAAYGAIVQDPQGLVVAHLSEFLGRQTNNFAEYSGLLAVLGWSLEHGVRSLRVISDSELMVNQMKGRYKVASPVLRPLWHEAKRRVARLERFELRHTLRDGNKEADRLANEAMDKGSGKAAEIAGQPEKGRPASQQLEGVVREGVVHLLDGDLPEGTFVTVIRRQAR
ncbi:MAG TPA: ribonuclease HI family protein [Terracidiphilus sp.]|nr:ribonuclease HI family protein [Terracidiphilus sp.]